MGCSEDPSSNNKGSEVLTNGLYQYDPCTELRFKDGLTESNFTRLVECFHVTGKINKDVRELLTSEPQFVVSTFNTLFTDPKIRQESFELFEDLEASGGLDATLSFLGSLIGSRPFEKLFLKTDASTKSLAQALIDDDINLSQALSHFFSSPHFLDFQHLLDKIVTEKAFPGLATSLGQFLTQKVDGKSGAQLIVELLGSLGDVTSPLLTSAEIHELAKNKTGGNVMRTFTRHAHDNPALIAANQDILGLTGQFTLFSGLLWKLTHTQTPLIFNSGDQKDFEMLLELLQTLNRPLIIQNLESSNLQPNLLVSLDKFLASMVTFFNTASSPEDTEEIIVERLKTMSTYFIFINLIHKEMHDTNYGELSTKDKLKFVFEEYKSRFVFNSNARIKKVFNDKEAKVEKLIGFFSKNPLIAYLNELEQNNINLISAFAPKTAPLLTDPQLIQALQKTIQEFFNVTNQPIDAFLKRDKDETEVWLDYTLSFINTNLSTSIPLTDLKLITAVVKTYQLHESILKGEYFQGISPSLLGDVLTQSSNALKLLPTLLARLDNTQMGNPLMNLLNRLVGSHLLDTSLIFTANSVDDFADIFDEALEELTAGNPNQNTLGGPLLKSFILLAKNPDTKMKLESFLEAVGDFLLYYEVREGESNHYLSQLLKTYKTYRQTSVTPLGLHFTKEENVRALFRILSEAIRKDVLSDNAPLLQQALQGEQFKNVFKVMANVLRYSRNKE